MIVSHTLKMNSLYNIIRTILISYGGFYFSGISMVALLSPRMEHISQVGIKQLMINVERSSVAPI